MTVECLLCAEEAHLIGVGECNHQPICFRCIYKLRVVSKNNLCPICKTSLTRIIMTDVFTPFSTLCEQTVCFGQYSDIGFLSMEAQGAFEQLSSVRCFVRKNGVACTTDKKFASTAFLKRHLKEQHNRYMCDICLEKMTCVLEEQRLYTYKELDKHMMRGDVDEFNNITFLHPYCFFCKRHFYDSEEFKVHLNREHMPCTVCGVQRQYTYYRDYNSLETHFKMSHYVCSDANCVAKKWVAFASADQLRMHRVQYHEKGNKHIDAREYCGFRSEGQVEEKIQIRDSEGVNMEEQFLNLKKCKNKALAEADHQIDTTIDPKAFYSHPHCDLEAHLDKAFAPLEQKKKKYVQKTQVSVEAMKSSLCTLYIQDIQMIKPIEVPKLPPNQFQNRLKSIVSGQVFNEWIQLRSKLAKGQIPLRDFFQAFGRLLHPRPPYMILMHFIRTLYQQDLKYQADEALGLFLSCLPSRKQSIVSQSKKYSDLFSKVKKELEMAIEKRIRNGEISLKSPVTREKERLFQIVGVVRRLKIVQMVHLKFALNFGVSQRSLSWFGQGLIQDIESFRRGLLQVPCSQLLDMYVFVNYCLQTICQRINVERHKIHEEILEDFLFEHPKLLEEYGTRKEDLLSLDEQVHFETKEEDRRAKAQVKEMQKNTHSRNIHFNIADKNDFPQLVGASKHPVKDTQSYKNIYEDTKSKPATYQKNLNEMFPSLEEAHKKEEGQWWDKLKDHKKEEETEEQPVSKRKGKKKYEKVEIKGIFN